MVDLKKFHPESTDGPKDEVFKNMHIFFHYTTLDKEEKDNCWLLHFLEYFVSMVVKIEELSWIIYESYEFF